MGRPNGVNLTQSDQFHFLGFLFLPASLGQILSRVGSVPTCVPSALAGGIKSPAGRPRGLGPVKCHLKPHTDEVTEQERGQH